MTKETSFFSYSRSDSNFVLKLAKDLRNAGADLWLDQLDIKAGSRWDASIEDALESASRLIVVLSPASVASNNVMDEVSYALESNKTVIPVLLSECKAPFRLKRLQHIDFTGDYQTALDQLLELLGYTAGSNKKAAIQKQEPEVDPAMISEVTPVDEKKNIEESESKLWEEANRINSISSYKKYLDESIMDLHKEKAQQLINKLAAEQKDKENEKLFWEKSRAKNTFIAYMQYVDNYPDGKYKLDALTAINKIEETEKKKATETLQPENFSGAIETKNTGSKKYIFIGVGVIILVLGIWGIINMLSGKSKDKIVDSAINLQKNDNPNSNAKTDSIGNPAAANYPNIKIANQVWMLKNLDVSTYRNGDPVPQVADQTEWSTLTTGAWCWYNNDSAAYGATYGKLYNWYAVNDPRGLAPKGWHIPSENEMMALAKSIDPGAGNDGYIKYNTNTAGGALKETGTSHWKSPNTGATNSSGFTALPTGLRDGTSGFDYSGRFGSFWSTSEYEAQKEFATYMEMARNESSVSISSTPKINGYAVRCIRD